MASTIGTHEMDASIQCPACRASGTFHTWDIIDAGDVSLKDRVLFDENLFFIPVLTAKVRSILKASASISTGTRNC